MNDSAFHGFRFCALTWLALTLTACTNVPNADYASALKKSLGDDVKDYQVLSYPTNAFGVGTVFNPQQLGQPVSNGDQLCGTWKCLGAPGEVMPPDPVAALNVIVRGTNYAELGEGGSVKLDTNSASDYAVKVALPKIYQLLNLGGSVDYGSVTRVELEFGKATKRYLSKPDFIAYLNDAGSSTPTKRSLQNAFAQGALVVVVADVLIDSMKATVTTSKDVASQLDAKLGALASPVLSDAQAGFRVTKKDSATYVIESLQPVVALRLLRAQPAAGLLGTEITWNDWAMVTGPTDPPPVNSADRTTSVDTNRVARIAPEPRRQ